MQIPLMSWNCLEQNEYMEFLLFKEMSTSTRLSTGVRHTRMYISGPNRQVHHRPIFFLRRKRLVATRVFNVRFMHAVALSKLLYCHP